MKTLLDVQQGDIIGYYGFTAAFTVMVTKATAKTITVGAGVPQRFSRATGLKVGSALARPYVKTLDEPTP